MKVSAVSANKPRMAALGNIRGVSKIALQPISTLSPTKGGKLRGRLLESRPVMPRQFLRQLSRRAQTIRDKWYIRPFANSIFDSRLWSLQRRSVTMGFGIGIAICFIPLPLQVPIGLLVAMIARLNVPAVVSATFLVNPFTALPVYLMCYTLGTWMLGLPLYPFAFEPSWAWVRNELLLIWRPLLLGCLTCGLMAGFASWLLLDRFWLWRVRKKYRDRHRREQR